MIPQMCDHGTLLAGRDYYYYHMVILICVISYQVNRKNALIFSTYVTVGIQWQDDIHSGMYLYQCIVSE